MRQIALLLIPAAAATIALAGADHPARLSARRVRRRARPDQVSEALFWFSFSLPFSRLQPAAHAHLLLASRSRGLPTALAGVTLVINVAVSAALYEPMGIGGVVLGTVVATAAMTIGQARVPSTPHRRPQLGTTLKAVAKIIARGRGARRLAYGTWSALDDALGRSLLATGRLRRRRIGARVAPPTPAIVLAMRIPEARQILELFTSRLRP